jgi:hypothetical protein
VRAYGLSVSAANVSVSTDELSVSTAKVSVSTDGLSVSTAKVSVRSLIRGGEARAGSKIAAESRLIAAVQSMIAHDPRKRRDCRSVSDLVDYERVKGKPAL